ncbi:MAG: hypothetical protein H6813_00990 [Phycisphaeraceae bacterium]|nr:hypothetical protein [Phycisphaeraceae bacterium]MCB9847338.1 hypothetical protein [Phycisphaeraceae bacterium]
MPISKSMCTDEERRGSERWTTQKTLRWRLRGDSHTSEGTIVERSLNGIVLLTEGVDAPQLGEHLKPATKEMAERHGFRCAVVVRCVNDPGLGQSRVYLEILA